MVQFGCGVVAQWLSHVRFFVIPWTACQASLSFAISRGLLKLMSIESVMPSNHFILCALLLHLPSIFPSIGDFSNDALCIRWSKYWSFSFSFSISSSNEYPGLLSFRIDWFDLLAVQVTLDSLIQHHHSVQFSSVTQSCPTLCDAINCSMPGLPVHHQLPEFTQTHVH